MPAPTAQDPDWPDVAALQAGDNAALDRLMKRHHAEVIGFIWQMTGNQRDAEELAQETFVRVFFQIQQYRPKSPFAAWLYRIARNLCLDYFRSRAHRQKTRSIPLDDLPDIAEPNARPAMDEASQRLHDAISQLPLQLREPLVLTALEGMSHAEAGRRLDISPKAIEVKCYRARERLRRILKKIQIG